LSLGHILDRAADAAAKTASTTAVIAIEAKGFAAIRSW
jgi:hypothetical protein